jgi:F-type H+-transporting ATPase subunit b
MNEVSGLLKQLYISSIPTIIFVIILFIVLERVLFRPLAAVMKRRADATEGAMLKARQQAAEAEAKFQEYAGKIQSARLKMYAARHEDRQKALAERESNLRTARAHADALVKEAQAAIAAEAATAKDQLEASSYALAGEIAGRILAEGVRPGAPESFRP